MTPGYYDALAPELQQLVDRIEKHCGFQIDVVWTRSLTARGLLSHRPTSITIHHREFMAEPAVICHELCHAERYFVLGIPFMQLEPPRKIMGADNSSIDAAENLDNMLEHIIVLSEMKERFGFEKDPTHVREDISSYERWPKDKFSRKCLALCNAALVHFHFPVLSPHIEIILAAEGLTQVAHELINILAQNLGSKPRMLEGLIRVLGISEDEVQLRARTCRGCDYDFGGPLRDWLRDGLDRYTPDCETRVKTDSDESKSSSKSSSKPASEVPHRVE
jgi:hypothetical protein